MHLVYTDIHECFHERFWTRQIQNMLEITIIKVRKPKSLPDLRF